MHPVFKYVLRIFKSIVIYFFFLSLLGVFIFRFFPPPFTPLMLIRYGEAKLNGKSSNWNYDWKDIEDMPYNFPRAVVASEDQNFMSHRGFDYKAIKKAIESNYGLKASGNLKGGSTISQQVAKNLFLWPGRSYVRKGLEAYFTYLLELFWSKKRIIEIYINIAELGIGTYGVEAASRQYYKKGSSEISSGQAAMLAAILPNPRKWSPVKPSTYIKKRQRWILQNMKNFKDLNFSE